MFCYQCEETVNGEGCTKAGVCGKTGDVSDLQDLLIFTLGEIAASNPGPDERAFVQEELFATITNANFDEAHFLERIQEACAIRDMLKDKSGSSPGWKEETRDGLLTRAKTVGINSLGTDDVKSLKSIILYGLKGIAAYGHHALVLGKVDEEVDSFMMEALAALHKDQSAEDLLAMVDRCGLMGVKVMALLDKANSDVYGIKTPKAVSTGAGSRPGILVSGHDLKDIHDLLEQSKDAGIDIYTHGEMLPTHAYPELSKYEHLKGNYGGSWHLQGTEFNSFNGPILLTTNCLIPPRTAYRDRLYTTGAVGWAEIPHISAKDGVKDFSKIIEQAKTCAPPTELENGSVTTGFGHEALIANAEKILGLVKEGKITKFVVMAGCDGRQPDRSYYTEFAEALPKTAIILTAGCAKYRYNKLNLGDIEGIPRVVDAGQCNDSYSLVVIAQELAKALGVGVNDLPLAFNIAWYEQKAVLVLLALLHLGVKGIMLGPKLPAFVTPGVLDVLVKNYDIKPNSTVEEDLKILI